MSPRVSKLPLPGGDRKHFCRELQRVERLHADLVKQTAAFVVAKFFSRKKNKICREPGGTQFHVVLIRAPGSKKVSCDVSKKNGF